MVPIEWQTMRRVALVMHSEKPKPDQGEESTRAYQQWFSLVRVMATQTLEEHERDHFCALAIFGPGFKK